VSAAMTQTSLFVKMVCKPGTRDRAVEALGAMLPQVESEPGTLIYSFHLDAGDEDALWIFELYTDGDALAAHGSSDAIKAMGAAMADLLAEPPTMIMATPTDANKGLPS
jgi:quinol monooxygenase YgiN